MPVRNHLQNYLVALLLAFGMAGCISADFIPDPSLDGMNLFPFMFIDRDRDDESLYSPLPVSNIAKRLIPGDVIRIETTEGKRHTLRVQAVEAQTFVGTASDRKNYRVAYSVIERVWIRRVAG